MHYVFLCLLRLSHDLQTFLNVLMHVDLFSGMYTSQGSGDIPAHVWKLVNFRGTSAHFRRIFKQVKQCIVFLCLLRLSHDLQTFLNVLTHVDLLSGMYTSQGSGNILVRMCGSWETFVVHQRTFNAFSNKLNSALCLFMPFAPLTRTAEIFKCSNACRPVQWDVH